MTDETRNPLWLRLLFSVARILTLFVIIVGGLYLWNPQKINYPRKKPPVPNPRVDPDSAKLFSKGTRVTVVSGHPDDTEFYISGTLLKLAKAGAEITLIVITDGDKSYYPPYTTDVEANRRVRRKEQEKAGEAYGAKVIMLGGPDGRYDPDASDLRQKLLAAMIQSKPDYIFAFESKYLPTIQHRDHENSGRAATELAWQTSAKWLLLYATTADNYYVDTTGTWEQRENLLAVHASQFFGEKLERVRGFVMERAVEDGEVIGTEIAEGFRAIQPTKPPRKVVDWHYPVSIVICGAVVFFYAIRTHTQKPNRLLTVFIWVAVLLPVISFLYRSENSKAQLHTVGLTIGPMLASYLGWNHRLKHVRKKVETNQPQ